jgi:hypothetical protein
VYKAWGANDEVLGYIIICFFGVFGVFGPCVKIGHLFLRRRARTPLLSPFIINLCKAGEISRVVELIEI